MDPFNPELFKRNSATKRKAEVIKPPPRHGQGEQFLKGPIPWNWLTAASRFSGKGKALHVAIACWFRAGITKNRAIKLSGSDIREMGIDRNACYRGLKRLEKAGLISVNRHEGQSPEVVILESNGL